MSRPGRSRAPQCHFVASMVIVLMKKKPDMKYIPAAFSLWWMFGTGAMTFRSPFITVGNGWLSAWAALLLSVQMCADQHGFELPTSVMKPEMADASFKWYPMPENEVPPPLGKSVVDEEDSALLVLSRKLTGKPDPSICTRRNLIDLLVVPCSFCIR
eukprot:FR743447.1.p1 GENE.FR743447.1~~FR743447.1.p1  ORF type:complete len:157 (+),score=8.35 FR743447.1:90-560(+)